MIKVPYLENFAIVYEDGPFGFYYIRLEKGVTPKELTGAYTSETKAEKAVEEHLNTKKKD